MENRELDIQIATKVFGANVEFLNQKSGWRVDYVADKDECNDPIWTDYGADGYRLKKYSIDIRAAWEVVDKLKTVNPNVYHLSRALKLTLSYGGTGYPWRAEFHLENDHAGDDQTYWFAEGKTPSEAICFAALKTIGG